MEIVDSTRFQHPQVSPGNSAFHIQETDTHVITSAIQEMGLVVRAVDDRGPCKAESHGPEQPLMQAAGWVESQAVNSAVDMESLQPFAGFLEMAVLDMVVDNLLDWMWAAKSTTNRCTTIMFSPHVVDI